MAQLFQLYQHQGEMQIYSQLNIHQHLHQQPIFWSVWLEVTRLLKSSCRHCSNNSRGQQLEALHSSCLRWSNTQQSNRCQYNIVFEILSFTLYSFHMLRASNRMNKNKNSAPNAHVSKMETSRFSVIEWVIRDALTKRCI